MENIPASRNAQVLARLLERINRGLDTKTLRQEAHELFLSLAPADIASAEQSLIENGFPAKLVQQLSMAFIFYGYPG